VPPLTLQQSLGEIVNHLAAVAPAFHDAGMLEHSQVMRGIDEFQFQFLSNLADVLRASTQQIDDAQTSRLGESLEEQGAAIRLECILRHGRNSIFRELRLRTSLSRMTSETGAG